MRLGLGLGLHAPPILTGIAAAGDTEAPTAPANLSANAVSTTQIDLTWDASTDNEGVTGYRIYRDNALIDTVAETSYSDTGLTGGTAGSTTYEYEVSAIDAAANESARSDPATENTPGLVLIDLTGLTTIVGGTPNNTAAAFDGVTNAATGSCMNGTTVAVGKTMATPKIFGRAILYGSNNDGFVQTDPADFTLEIRGKTGAAPTNFATDGSAVGSLTATDQANESAGRTIDSTDLVTAWDHIWCRVTSPSGTEFLAELVLYEWVL